MKNIHVSPTDKPSMLYLFEERLILGDLKTVVFKNSGAVNQNIYITSDEDIMIKDFYLAGVNIYECLSSAELEDLSIDRYCKKIILTTDVHLIKDGIQAIDDKFLEWFVKNPSCDEVEVERDSREVCGHNGGVFIEYGLYEILIPKEEPKQETLEEAANKANGYNVYAKETKAPIFNEGFIEGAKWQQEQDKNKYSEEEVENILIEYVKTNPTKPYRVINWFRQIKKK